MADLSRLFEPQTVAVVGASDDPTKFGNRVMRSILEGGFKGDLFPVNPTAETIQGRRAYRSVELDRCHIFEVYGSTENPWVALSFLSNKAIWD